MKNGYRYVWALTGSIRVGRRIGPEEDARMEQGLSPWPEAYDSMEPLAEGEVIHYYPDCGSESVFDDGLHRVGASRL